MLHVLILLAVTERLPVPKLILEFAKRKADSVLFTQVFTVLTSLSSMGGRKSQNCPERQQMQDHQIPVIPVTHPGPLSEIPGFHAASGGVI